MKIEGQPAARDGDQVCCGSELTNGSRVVRIGDSPGAAPVITLIALPAMALQLIGQIGTILGKMPFGPQPGQQQQGQQQPGQQPPGQQPPPQVQVIPPAEVKVDDGSPQIVFPDPVKAKP